MSFWRLQLLNGFTSLTPISEFWQLGTLTQVDPQIPNLPIDAVFPVSTSGNISLVQVYGQPYAQSLRTWTQSPFIGNIPGLVPSPFAQFDWPNPKAAPYATSLRTHLQGFNALTQTALFVPPPFYQTDWPLPKQTKRAQQSIPGQALPLFTLAYPFQQSDWPLPKAPQKAKDFQQTQSLVVSTLAVPFHQLDWPLPKIAQRPTPTQQPQNPLMTHLAPVPFAWMGWTLPVRALQPLRIDYQRYSFALTYPYAPEPDCGHLTPGASAGSDLGPNITAPGLLTETISTAGKTRTSASKASLRATVSMGGNLNSEIPC